MCSLETLETRQLYLGNIGVTINAENIHAMFTGYNLVDVRIPVDRDGGIIPKMVITCLLSWKNIMSTCEPAVQAQADIIKKVLLECASSNDYTQTSALSLGMQSAKFVFPASPPSW